MTIQCVQMSHITYCKEISCTIIFPGVKNYPFSLFSLLCQCVTQVVIFIFIFQHPSGLLRHLSWVAFLAYCITTLMGVYSSVVSLRKGVWRLIFWDLECLKIFSFYSHSWMIVWLHVKFWKKDPFPQNSPIRRQLLHCLPVSFVLLRTPMLFWLLILWLWIFFS